MIYYCLIRKFKRDVRGVSAVEAALVTPIFLPFLVFIFELLAFLFTSSSMDYALDKAMLNLRFGEAPGLASQNNLNANQFYKKTICERLFIANCEQKLTVKVETYNTNGTLAATLGNEFTQSSTLVYFEASVETPINLFLKLAGSNTTTIKASSFFMTEPY